MSVKISNELVKSLRISRGWTQEHLADACGLTTKTIQRVEKSGICSFETRNALLSVFEIELKQLEGEEKVQQASAQGEDGLLYYSRLCSGRKIMEVFQNTHAYRLTNEDARSEEHSNVIAATLGTIQDWSEIWDELEVEAQIKAQYSLGELLKELEDDGLWLFGLRTKAKYKFPNVEAQGAEMKWSTCNFHVAYADSNNVIALNPRG